MRVQLVDTDGVTEKRDMKRREIINYVRGLIKNGRPFVIATDGGLLEVGCTCYTAAEYDGERYVGGSDDCPIHGLIPIQ